MTLMILMIKTYIKRLFWEF